MPKSSWSLLRLPRIVLDWVRSLGQPTMAEEPPEIPPRTYFAIVVDGGEMNSERITTDVISLEEAKGMLRSGTLVNLESYEWLLHLLCLRLNTTLVMNETQSELPVFRAGDRFLLAHFTRKGDRAAEPAMENLKDAEISFTLGVFH